MNRNESALGRWLVVPDTTEKGIDSPKIESQLESHGLDGRERAEGAGNERAAFWRMPTSPARFDPTLARIVGERRYDGGLPNAVASGAMRWWRDSHPSVAPSSDAAAEELARTRLAERLGELRQLLDHLRDIRIRIQVEAPPEHSLSLRNDVLFSRLMICQVAIDLAGELVRQRGERCDDDMRALRKLVGDRRVPPEVVDELERLLGFRNALIYGGVARDTTAVRTALDGIEVFERFLEVARDIAASRR